EVVAIGTGNDCIQANCLMTNGRVIIDCHAEVMARRALLKWIYGEIRKVTAGGHADCIFERPKTGGGKIRMKEQGSLHMYISSHPCGDAAKFQCKSVEMVIVVVVILCVCVCLCVCVNVSVRVNHHSLVFFILF
ncbi:hypothetical protein HELRODRAFT_68171, partial [Helobdella robusta]|uniref:A to I editase domain-containing protein n=1 Tax=Helobdella robusta TaxID=6412 RepID=T1FZB2_HELRO